MDELLPMVMALASVVSRCRKSEWNGLVQLLLHIHCFILSFLNQEIREKLNIKIGGFCGRNTLPQADF